MRTALALLVLTGCAGAISQAEAAKRTYEAEDATCVTVYATRAEIDACRATVRALWGQPARDAGGDR